MRVYKTETQLRNMATELASVITTRINGTDSKRATTEMEREMLYKLFYGALLELNRNGGSQFDYGVLNCAEMTADLFIPYMNGYNTIFCPLRRVLENWETD